MAHSHAWKQQRTCVSYYGSQAARILQAQIVRVHVPFVAGGGCTERRQSSHTTTAACDAASLCIS